MSPILFFYLANLIENMLGAALICLSIFCAITMLYAMHNNFEGDNKDTIVFLKKAKPYLIVAVIFLAIMPNKQTMYLMAASSVVMDVSKNERVQSIANNSLNLIEQKIKEYTQETNSQKDEK